MVEHDESSVIEFNRDGLMVHTWHRNAEGSESTITCEYEYDANRLIAVRIHFGNGAVQVRTYDYDTTGRLQRVACRSDNGSIQFAELYEYDSQGRKKKIIPINEPPSSSPFVLGLEGTDTSYAVPGTRSVTMTYDHRDLPAEAVSQDADGNALGRVEFTYDERARLIEEVKTESAEMPLAEITCGLSPDQLDIVRTAFAAACSPIRSSYRYDEKGRRVERRLQFGLLGTDMETTEYNDYGDPVRIVMENESHEYQINDEGKLTEVAESTKRFQSETRSQYECDSHGNWVHKTTEARSSPESEFIRWSTETRVIDYFD